MKSPFSSTRRSVVYGATMIGTVACIAATLMVDSPNFVNLSQDALRRALMIDILLPAALAAPLLFIFMSKIRQLNLAREELELIASTDSLTRILNRGAFTMLVDAYLEKASKQEPVPPGALLVVDADHFKLINDRFGHAAGDNALVSIASTLQSSLRERDLVGRIGGEEFGVFLPNSEAQQAEIVAERIRSGVRAIDFHPMGDRYSLSVSIGGVIYDRKTSYDELFGAADQRLYFAKKSGRDQVKICFLSTFLDQKKDMSIVAAVLGVS
ncbi:MAG: GGDEF domain-containing protein [Oricola sp.]